jgi:hypothetical protein
MTQPSSKETALIVIILAVGALLVNNSSYRLLVPPLSVAPSEIAPAAQKEMEERPNSHKRAWDDEANTRNFCMVVIAEEWARKYGLDRETYISNYRRWLHMQDAPLEELNDAWSEEMKEAFGKNRGGREVGEKILEELRIHENCR